MKNWPNSFTLASYEIVICFEGLCMDLVTTILMGFESPADLVIVGVYVMGYL